MEELHRTVAFLLNDADDDQTLAGFRGSITSAFDLDLVSRDQLDSYDFSRSIAVADCGGLAGQPEILDRAIAAGVRFWQIIGTGVDHVDVARLQEAGVDVASVPGFVSAHALAEHALMLMLAVLRRLPEAVKNSTAGLLNAPFVTELRGLCLGLIGFGASGRALAAIARPLGMSVLACDVRAMDTSEVEHLDDFWFGPGGLSHVLGSAQVVSLHAPLTADSYRMIATDQFNEMRQGAILINVARGGLVDTDALVGALQSGWLGGAGLDTVDPEPLPTDHVLHKICSVVLTPHHAVMTPKTLSARGAWAAENVAKYLDPSHGAPSSLLPNPVGAS